jgi:hypothetical protein
MDRNERALVIGSLFAESQFPEARLNGIVRSVNVGSRFKARDVGEEEGQIGEVSGYCLPNLGYRMRLNAGEKL